MQSRDIDQAAFLAKHPLNFLLFYGDYELINTIYLDDGSPLVDLSMELFNQSTNQTVKFQKPTNLSASANNCHFYLSLEGDFTLEKAPEGWDIAVERSRNGQGDNFYFLKREGYDLQQKPANGSTNKIVLVLKSFRAVPEGGTRTIRAEMTYGPLLKDNNNQPFQDGFGQYSSYGNTIFITNNRGGKKTLPLQVGFAAGNAVINDGTSRNSLELLIANKNWPNNNLSLSPDSEFVISFEMDNKEAAVATVAQVQVIVINSNSSNWPVQHVANTTEWTVKPESGTNQLASDETIKLNITNLVTSNSSGAGYLYVRYKNIPNYPDGQFVVTVEKSPLLYRLAQVGIGTTTPAKQLHVVGDLVLGKNDANKKFIFHSRTGNTENNDFLQITSDNSQGNWVWEQGITLKRNGNVGIGTNTPSAKLHVKDGNAIVIGGNVGIGTDTPSAKLHVQGGDAIFSGKVGIGLDVPTDKLHIKDGDLRIDTGSIKSWGTIAFYPNTDKSSNEDLIKVMKSDGNSAAMLVNHEGNVGIGTTTPSAKLHVSGGDAIVSGKLAIGTTVSSHIHLTIGDNDTGLKQQGDGQLAIYTDNQERVRINPSGNVGIGTTSPSAKLDIHGDFHIKGKKPMEYRYYTSNQDDPKFTTDYLVSDWIVIVAGIHTDASRNANRMQGLKAIPWEGTNGKWEIHCATFGQVENSWGIRVLFIRREMADLL